MDKLIILKTLHIVGALALFSSLGATLLGSSNKKAASILHGVSLLFILLIGFAILGKPPAGQYWWIAKLVLWLFIGFAPVLAKRKVLPAPLVLVVCLTAAFGAAWLGLSKPF
ncbi:MAG: hypothetical protein H8M99_04865 [Gloeobacteraceae cyanobacterium ES-bin-144]|nr:hypothetical protein [Verrucomicrobiales bacterium]